HNWSSRIQVAQKNLEEFQTHRRRNQQEQWIQLKSGWETGWQSFDAAVQQALQELNAVCPPWESLVHGGWQVPAQIPPFVHMGEFRINLNNWPGAISDDPRLAPRRTEYQYPLTLTFPSAVS